MSENNQSLEEILFELAVQKPTPAERAAFLDGACRGNPALRAQLDELLEAHFGEAGFLPKPPARSAFPATGPSIPAGEAPARMIGRYKLLEKIGEGAMGEVWMAEQREPVKRRVALKLIKPGMDSRQIVARFEAERQALAMMDHPNIARIFDAGATENGRPYLVMELVRGIKITDYCDAHQLPTRERLNLFILVCQAIQHAHQKGIIHRDIKPSNILVTLLDGVPAAKVIDFGIAKATQAELTDKTLLTQFHQFIGTPAYISPEQAGMTGVDIDTRSDIYSLGVLLYQLLTGLTPFDAQELAKAGLDAMRRTIREVEPQRPSTRLSTLHGEALTVTARQHGTEGARLLRLIQGDLDWIVMKCLEKDRTRRYDTANALAVDLGRHLDNAPVAARPPSAAYRLQKAWRRHRTAFVAAALVATVLVAATGISAWQAILAKQRLAESEAILQFLTQVFQSPEPARYGSKITVAETLGTAAKRLEKDLAGQPARRAELQATIGLTYHDLGLYREAIALQEKVRDYYLLASGPEHPDTLKAMHRLAFSYDRAGRWGEALELRERVLALRRKVSGPEHPATLSAIEGLADSYDEAGRRGEALKLREQVLALRRKVIGPEHHNTLVAMRTLANSYAEAGRRDEALKLREESLPLSRKVNGPEHPETLDAMLNLANSYADAGRREEALKLREQVLALSRRVSGPEHPDTLKAMLNLANSYDETGSRGEALKLRESVLSLYRKVGDPEAPGTLNAMLNLANSYDENGRRGEALKLREDLLSLRRKVTGPEHPDTLGAMNNLANSYAGAGRRDEALRLREELLPLRRKVNGPEHPDTLGAMNNLANSYADAGRREEALKLREQVLALRRKVSGPEDPETLRAMDNLALSFDAAGRRDEAVKLREELLPLRRKVSGPEHPDTLIAIQNLANSYDGFARREEALKLRAEALALLRKVSGPEHPETLWAMIALADSYRKAGRADEAVKLGQSSLEIFGRVSGATNENTLNAMTKLAVSYRAARRTAEAIGLEEQSLRLKRQNLPAGHPGLAESMENLAACYEESGRKPEAEPLRRELAQLKAKTEKPNPGAGPPNPPPAKP